MSFGFRFLLDYLHLSCFVVAVKTRWSILGGDGASGYGASGYEDHHLGEMEHRGEMGHLGCRLTISCQKIVETAAAGKNLCVMMWQD